MERFWVRGLGEDKTRAPIFFFLASKQILQRQKVGKTNLGLSYFLGKMGFILFYLFSENLLIFLRFCYYVMVSSPSSSYSNLWSFIH